nr:MAG TPA: hypothetical protein [Caudoviricetes sp.]
MKKIKDLEKYFNFYDPNGKSIGGKYYAYSRQQFRCQF